LGVSDGPWVILTLDPGKGAANHDKAGRMGTNED